MTFLARSQVEMKVHSHCRRLKNKKMIGSHASDFVSGEGIKERRE